MPRSPTVRGSIPALALLLLGACSHESAAPAAPAAVRSGGTSTAASTPSATPPVVADATPAPAPPRLPIAVPPARTILKQGPDEEIQCFDFYSTLADMVRNAPSGPVLVALHGRGSSRGAFHDLAPDLQKRGIAVLAVDLRSGKSFGSTENISALHYRRRHEKDASVTEDAADIPFALDRVREYAPHARLALLAEGPAASQALAFAAASPERVEALFLFSPEGVEGLDTAASNAQVRVPVYATCGHGAEEEARLHAAVRGVDEKWLTVFVPPADVQAAPGIATLLVERDADRERQRAVLLERMLALCPK